MDVLDATLNDFQIKSIKSQCSGFKLFFEFVENIGLGKICHTTIHIYDLEDVFCRSVQSYKLDRENMRWEKLELEQIIKSINKSEPASHLIFVGEDDNLELRPKNSPNYIKKLP